MNRASPHCEEFSFSDPPFYSCIRILEFEFEFSNAFEFLNLNLQMLLSFFKKIPFGTTGNSYYSVTLRRR